MTSGVEWIVDVGVVGLLVSIVVGAIAAGIVLGEVARVIFSGEAGLSAPAVDMFLEDVLGGVGASLFFGGVNLMIETYMLKEMVAGAAEPTGILIESIAFGFALI